MKNWKGWALVVLAAVALASPAFAVSKSGPYLRTDQLTWRVHKAAFLAGYQQDAVGGYLDSVAFNRIGVGGATMGVANAETTTAISTLGWTTPPSAATTINKAKRRTWPPTQSRSVLAREIIVRPGRGCARR